MRLHFIFIVMLCILFFSGFGCVQVKEKEKEKAALAAAQKWLLLVDSGNYGQSWEEASVYFKNFVTQKQWQESLNAVREPLGKVISREVGSIKYKKSLPGAPDGEYMVIKLVSSFANKELAVETVILAIEKDNIWRLSGYYIK